MNPHLPFGGPRSRGHALIACNLLRNPRRLAPGLVRFVFGKNDQNNNGITFIFIMISFNVFGCRTQNSLTIPYFESNMMLKQVN
jgi:hypothetical protein